MGSVVAVAKPAGWEAWVLRGGSGLQGVLVGSFLMGCLLHFEWAV